MRQKLRNAINLYSGKRGERCRGCPEIISIVSESLRGPSASFARGKDVRFRGRFVLFALFRVGVYFRYCLVFKFGFYFGNECVFLLGMII